MLAKTGRLRRWLLAMIVALVAGGLAQGVAQATPVSHPGPTSSATSTGAGAARNQAAPTGSAASTAPPPASTAPLPAPGGPSPAQPFRQVCGQPATPGAVACMSVLRTDVAARRGVLAPNAVPPAGYGPADLRQAYHLPTTGGAGATVAVVDAYDNPTAEADLAVYRQQFGLPACTTANGCFRKIDQRGGTKYPPADPNWSVEIALDLEMISAACPNCHLLLVEADNANFDPIGAAENQAVAQGAKYVSNSYGAYLDGSVVLGLTSKYYQHPGVAITVSSGDGGYGTTFPASSPQVTAVGGTSLVRDASTSRGWSETVWHNGSGGPGSGCSSVQPKPSWQTDTGCPNRTVADVSAVADPRTGVATYTTTGLGGWGVVGGTSAASPLIAGIYALAGTPTTASSPVSYPYHNPAALNDVTAGNNGICSPAYLCTAGPGYDGPTGLGTPNGVAAFTLGPNGTLTGTITDAATGRPLSGAQIGIAGVTASTDAQGHYAVVVGVGSYAATASAFGYANATASGVTVTNGGTVSRNFALRALPTTTVSGTVTDGSGHGWPLYAKIEVPGSPVVTHTDPVTGRYHLTLPQNADYHLHVTSIESGYQAGDVVVSLGVSAISHDVALPVNPAGCAASGYASVTKLLETFDQPTLPAGWTMVDHPGVGSSGGIVWRFNNPYGGPNRTGGTGGFATAEGDPGYPLGTQGVPGADTELISPVLDLSADPLPQLEFDSWKGVSVLVGEYDKVEVSADGGQTWTVAFQLTGVGSGDALIGHKTIALPQLAHQAAARIRFHLSMPVFGGTGSSNYWEIDNVTVADCVPRPGGLVVGRITDANTGQGVVGATITSGDTGKSTTSIATPDDPAVGDGFYSTFSPTVGSIAVTASARNYTTVTRNAAVVANQANQLTLALPAGRLAVGATSLSATKTMGGSTTASLTLRNTGTAPVTVNLSDQPGGFTALDQPAAGPAMSAPQASAAQTTPVRQVSGHFDPLDATAKTSGPAGPPIAPLAAQPADASWSPVANYPLVTSGTAAATDPLTGKVYSVGGQIQQTYDAPPTALSYVYTPSTGSWTRLPDMGFTRQLPQAAFLNGKLYVTGGRSTNGTGADLEVYDPGLNRWSFGASIPKPYLGAGTATVNGKMYVVGGCTDSTGCGTTDVQVYNPATDSWTTAASYPIPVSRLSCGGIGALLYCAGGVQQPTNGALQSYTAAYRYDPRANAWSRIADLPIDLWGSAYSASNGRLVISDGVTANGNVVTNQGFVYDPGTNTWTPLPNSPQPIYSAAGACGYYAIAGRPDVGGYTDAVQQLPGYGDCGGTTWLSENPAHTTIAPGQSSTVTVTLNAGDPAINRPGTYAGSIWVGNDTPYSAPTVPVTLTATPPPSWGKLIGTVTAHNCDGTTTPLAGATVQVTGKNGVWTLSTGSNGQYSLWLDRSNSPLSLIASMPGELSQARGNVKITAGKTTTVAFTLNRAAGC